MTPLPFPIACLPDPAVVTVSAVAASDSATLTLDLRPVARTGFCPQCQHSSSRVHSRYTRCVSDLPWGTHTVQVRLHTRRFFCDQPACPQRIFTERLPTVLAPHARRTTRLITHHTTLGMTLGGRLGARVCRVIACPLSRHQLIRDVRAAPKPVMPPPTVIGVDDWAIRKGQTYGTILIDLLTHRPLDLLPDRDADTLARWLTAHPTITHISRDRANVYADGCTRGAPSATQSADRWHLFQNLHDALLNQLANDPTILLPQVPQPAPVTLVPTPDEPPLTPEPLPRSPSQQARSDRQQHMHTLLARGWTQRAVAHHLGIHPKTVHRAIRRPTTTAPTQVARPSVLDPWIAHLCKRWQDGCTNGSALFREIRTAGYRGQSATVRAFITRLRKHGVSSFALTAPRSPTCRTLVAWMLTDQATRTAEQQQSLTTLQAQNPAFQRMVMLVEAFGMLIRTRNVTAWDGWLRDGEQSDFSDLHRLVRRFRQDDTIIRAALTLPWSQGPVEGTINRLKVLKRQMYGRAKIDLLQQRLCYRLQT